MSVKRKQKCPLGDMPHSEFSEKESALRWAENFVHRGPFAYEDNLDFRLKFLPFENQMSVSYEEAEARAKKIAEMGGIGLVHRAETGYPNLSDEELEEWEEGDLTDEDVLDAIPQDQLHYKHWALGFTSEKSLEQYLDRSLEISPYMDEDFDEQGRKTYGESSADCEFGSKVSRNYAYIFRK